MRKFALYNDAGERIELSAGQYFLENPAGLGVKLDQPINDIRNGFFKESVKDLIPQEPLVGDLVCNNTNAMTAYEAYRNIVDWLMLSNKIYFAYTPDGSATEYRRDVVLNFLTKTEVNAGNSMRCPVSFKVLSPWYAPTPVTLAFDTLPEIAELGIPYSAEVEAEGHIPAAVYVKTTNGSLPYLLTVSNDLTQGNVEFYSIVFPYLSGASTGDFEYSDRYGDSFFKFTSGGAEYDLVQTSGLQTDLYSRIPINTGGKVYFSVIFADGATLPESIEANIYYYYRSV